MRGAVGRCGGNCIAGAAVGPFVEFVRRMLVTPYPRVCSYARGLVNQSPWTLIRYSHTSRTICEAPWRCAEAGTDTGTTRQGGEKYQQAFYVFEELAQAPSTASIRSLVSQAVCELHLGRVEEAQAALEQALQKQPSYVEAIANMLVLQVISGGDATELTEYAPALCFPCAVSRLTRRTDA